VIKGSTTWSNASTNPLGGNFGLAIPGGYAQDRGSQWPRGVIEMTLG
jgi:hypothetical protein